MPRQKSIRVLCPAIRYTEQNDKTFDIENTMCRQHGSVEFGGACGEEHRTQCEKVRLIVFTKVIRLIIIMLTNNNLFAYSSHRMYSQTMNTL